MEESNEKEVARIKAEFFVRLKDYATSGTGETRKHDDYCYDLIEKLDEIDPIAALLMVWRERHAFEMQSSKYSGCCARARTEMWDVVADELEGTLRDGSVL